MIGRQNQKQLVTASGEQVHGGDGHGRCGVAAERLQQNGLRLVADSGKLLADDEAMFFVAHHDGLADALDGQAAERLLKQGLTAGEGQELLGIQLA